MNLLMLIIGVCIGLIFGFLLASYGVVMKEKEAVEGGVIILDGELYKISKID